MKLYGKTEFACEICKLKEQWGVFVAIYYDNWKDVINAGWFTNEEINMLTYKADQTMLILCDTESAAWDEFERFKTESYKSASVYAELIDNTGDSITENT
jgi:hypothetical protein